MKTSSFPLKYKTSDRWATEALKDPFSLLSDHAYLERKAASNALELLNRWPEPKRPKNWASTLSTIARDEAMHLRMVIKLIEDKGGHLERLHKSPYANELRKLVRMGKGPLEIMDRLLVSALIEARSCERFDLLAEACKESKMKSFYRSLHKSEHGHFTLFLRLAKQVCPSSEVMSRWEELLNAEAFLIANQPPGPRIHSNMP